MVQVSCLNAISAHDKPGGPDAFVYQVQDLYCSGSIIEASSKVQVEYIGRPQVALAVEVSSQKKELITRQPICVGQEDSLTLTFQGSYLCFGLCSEDGALLKCNLLSGRAPFKYRYRHVFKGQHGKTSEQVLERHSGGTTGLLPLSNSLGTHRYDVLQVADGAYGFQSKDPREAVFSVSQNVLARPSAAFQSSSTPNFCLDDTLAKKKNGPKITFDGQGPFSIQLEVRKSNRASGVIHNVQDIASKTWEVDIPGFTFTEIGSYLLRIVSITDASGCEWEPPIEDNLYMGMNVVEPASIRTIGEKSHYCVGDMLEYLLEGESECAPNHSLICYLVSDKR